MAVPRPGSSHSTRPPSSLSQRPISRISSRPLSRISGRTLVSRHAARVGQLTHTLVSQLAGTVLKEDADAFSDLYEKSLRILEVRQSISETLETIDVRMQRIARRSRINVQDNLATALIQTWTRLKVIAADDFQDEDEIRLSNLPELIQFLLELATPPVPSTLAHADIVLSGDYEPSSKPGKLTWAQIMEEEPFEGEHWIGIFSPGKGGPETDSSLSSEPEQESEMEDDRSKSDFSENSMTSDTSPASTPIANILDIQINHFRAPSLQDREVAETLREDQYWRPAQNNIVQWNRKFYIADPSTLAATVDKIFVPRLNEFPAGPKAVKEIDCVCEVLLLLQGFDSPITTFLPDDHQDRTQASIAENAPRIMHLSKSVYDSILMEFCFAATKLQEMRYFIRSIYSVHEEETRRYKTKHAYIQSTPARSQTLEALVEAVDIYIRDIETWCANKEEDILRARKGIGGPLVVTLLGCCHEMKEKMTSALEIVQDILLDVVRQEINKDDTTHHRTDVSKVGFLRAKAFTSIPPYIIAKRLLDSLVLSIKTQLAIGELATASKLSEIFVRTAAPVWNGIGQWLRDGMAIGIGENMDLDDFQEQSQNDELFIEKTDIEFVDPNFWEQGYTLREAADGAGEASPLVPDIFLELGKDILGAGKAVGLLRALGIDPFSEATESSLFPWKWENFERIFSSAATASSSSSESELAEPDGNQLAPDKTYNMRLTIENMQTIMEDRVMKWCQAAHSTLNGLLFEECSLQEHLFSLENMCFMRRGDAMTTFCDNIFMKLDSQQKWHDLHFLNSNLQSIASVDRVAWINTELVQFYVRGGRERNNAMTVRCFDGFKLEYLVSYPLTYLLRRPSAVVYSSIFVFLLQIRRSKTLIDRILLHNRRWRNGNRNEENDPNFTYALRSKFAWIVKSLFNFIVTHVIGAKLGPFHDQLRKAKSLDEMIALHDHHLALLQTLCFLQSKTVALHRSILAILDLALHFVSSVSLQIEQDQEESVRAPQPDDTYTKKKRRRHQRRARQARRNIIGFSDHRDAISSSSSSSGDEDEIVEDEKEVDLQDMSSHGRPSLVNSVSFAEESFVVKMDRISDELEGHVKYIKKAVDVLAGGSSEVGSTFAILSFMLEEWDM